MLSYFDNLCPKCSQDSIVELVFITKKQCANCGYKYLSEEGAFTGPLYINLSIMGLMTMPFIFLTALNTITPFEAAVGSIFCLIFISPFTLRLSKIFWVRTTKR